ncbi:50S ribosomal subunit protein L3 N(5)-glutamine methyltransferase [Gammaproteobacteria bacterium]
MSIKKRIQRNPKSNTNILKELNTIRDFIRLAVSRFGQAQIYFGHGSDNAWDEAVYLVLHTLHLPQNIDQAMLDAKLTIGEKQTVLKVISRRIKERVPAAYLTQEAWFAGLSFYVDERVLIPRSPMAELIQKQFTPWIDPKKVKRILDIGTGSGCIAIGCAYAFPNATIDAVDISKAALKVAAINCAKHNRTKQVRLLQSDLFGALENTTYDIIISNPPYVSRAEMQLLPQEYRHEPSGALLAGKNGDEIVEVILKEAPKHLSPNGILVVEVGNSEPVVLQKYPHLPFTWLEFEKGEAEVFLLTASQLKNC